MEFKVGNHGVEVLYFGVVMKFFATFPYELPGLGGLHGVAVDPELPPGHRQ